jgi:hypothetical protein
MIEYFANTGDLSNPVVSHSALNALEEHPLNFREMIEGSKEDIKISPSLERGDLLHKWLEKPDDFIFAELDKPSPQMSLFTETFNDLYFKEEWKIDEGFISAASAPFSIDLKDIFTVQELFTSFTGQKANDEQVQLLARCILYARKKAEVDKRLTDNTIFKKFESECTPYLRFLQNAGNRTIVSKQDKEILINAHYSLQSHPIAKQYLGNDYQNELEIYWSETINGVTIQRKGKIDKFKFENNKLTIVDTKTTSYSINNFKEGAYKKWNLGRQLYSYAVGYCYSNNINPATVDSIELINIVVQTNKNYPTSVFKISPGEFNVLAHSYLDVMKKAAFHIKNQIWDITMEEATEGFIYI